MTGVETVKDSFKFWGHMLRPQVLRAASVAQAAGKPLDHLRQWGLTVQERTSHNKAACALANKLARICYATLRDREIYSRDVLRMHRKLSAPTYPMHA